MENTKKISIRDIMTGGINYPMHQNIDDVPNKIKPHATAVKRREQKQSTPAIANKSYYEKLRDPRWQKLRLQVMERDNFQCKSCGRADKTLNVHHAVPYKKGHEPWQYELDELTTLCEDCHEQISEIVATCNLLIMGRCWCVDSANEMVKIMYELDALDPYELKIAWQILQLGIRHKAFKAEL